MGIAFWIRRFAVVFAGAFVVIAAAQLLKGRTAMHAATEGLVWAAVAASIFVAARLIQSRRGRHCALCRDTPQMRRHTASVSRTRAG